MDLNKIPKKNSKIVARKTGSEYVLVPIRDNIADMEAVYTLNETGAFIWELIDGRRTVKEIAEELPGEFEVDDKTALEDVVELLNSLAEYLVIE
jgi:hypothetical protein